MIKVREKMKVDNTWYALGATKWANVVVVVEEEKEIHYYFSSNSGKTFNHISASEGDVRNVLTVKWPAGAKPQFHSVADVKFFGQSKTQRNCTELKRHLIILGYITEEPKS